MYKIINEILDTYTNNGVNPVDLLEYLNNAEDNFVYILSKVQQRCTINDIEYDSEQLQEALKDNIRDRVAFINDILKATK